MSILKQRTTYYMVAIFMLTLKGSILGFGVAESLFGIALVSLEGFSQFIKYRQELSQGKEKDLIKELNGRISSLESKFSLVNSRK